MCCINFFSILFLYTLRQNLTLNIRQIIGNNVRCFRHKLKWSLKKLGTETVLHHHYLGRLERGLENVGIDNLAKLAVVFDTDPSNLPIQSFCVSTLIVNCHFLYV